MTRWTWPVPLLLGAATLAALVVALAGDGWSDMVSWVGLAAPIAAVAWAFASRRS